MAKIHANNKDSIRFDPSDYATKQYVNDEIVKVQISGGGGNIEVDASDLLPDRVSIASFGVNEGADITSIVNNLPEGNILVLNGSYKVTNTLILRNKQIIGGEMIYEGSTNNPVVTLRTGGGLFDTSIKINVKNYASDIILVDYIYDNIQWLDGGYNIENVKIDNEIQYEATGEPVENSCCVKIKIQGYQCIGHHIIRDLAFNGIIDYGIYLELLYRTTNDNPAYNSCMWTNIMFGSANCAFKAEPIYQNGEADISCAATISMVNFTNQCEEWVVKPFMDLVDIKVEGFMVIPWDYFGTWLTNKPEGIYKTKNSTILLTLSYFDDTIQPNPDVFTLFSMRSTGEFFSNVNVVKLRDVENNSPVRNTGGCWGMDNIKQVLFTPQSEYNPYDKTYMGFEMQRGNDVNYSNKYTYQFGVASDTGQIILRQYNGSSWDKPRNILVEGYMPESYSGNRPNGIDVGDMKFDTSLNKPVWWTGSKWVTADGQTAF